jgi:hypothetical protein
LDQFLLTKIDSSKISYYKWHLLKLVRIPTNENIFFVSIWNPTIPKSCLAQKQIIKNMFSCLSHHCNGHLMSLTSIW